MPGCEIPPARRPTGAVGLLPPRLPWTVARLQQLATDRRVAATAGTAPAADQSRRGGIPDTAPQSHQSTHGGHRGHWEDSCIFKVMILGQSRSQLHQPFHECSRRSQPSKPTINDGGRTAVSDEEQLAQEA